MNPSDVLKDFATTTSLVLALTQMIKVFIPNAKYHSIIAVMWGLIVCYGLTWFSTTGPLTKQVVGIAITTGVFSGVAAGGLYDSMHQSVQPGIK